MVDVLGESSDDITEFGDPQASNLKKADLVINGALLETKLSIYGKVRVAYPFQIFEVMCPLLFCQSLSKTHAYDLKQIF